MTVIQRCINTGHMTEVLVPSRSDRTRFYEVLVQDRHDLDSVLCCCEGFTFRGRCSHQREALARVCGWIEGDEPQTEYEKDHNLCPRCGDFTEGVEVNDK